MADAGGGGAAAAAERNPRSPGLAASIDKPLRICIIGAGIGGCSLAHWLRETFCDGLDLTVLSDGPVGGRCQSLDFDGQRYEAGASIVSELNEYFIGFMRRFGLRARFTNDLAFLPLGIFDGTSFSFREPDPTTMWLPSLAKARSALALVLRYGMRGLLNLRGLGKGAPDFTKLYAQQAAGKTFTEPGDLLDTIEPGLSQLSYRSTASWLADRAIPELLTNELATGAMRCNYGGQGCKDLHALVGLVALTGGLTSKCFSVVGGNDQIVSGLIKSAKPRLLKGSADSVKKVAGGFEVAYAMNRRQAMKVEDSAEGSNEDTPTVTEAFDVVVVAHPLERSSLRFEGIRPAPGFGTVPGTEPRGRFRRCIAHLVKGSLRRDYFGYGGDDGPLPVEILTSENSSAPFYSIGLQFPVRASTADEVRHIRDSALRGEPQVYKVFAPKVLAEEQLRMIFATPSSQTERKYEVVGWYAYPEYQIPQPLHSFVLDPDGVFYLNSIEQAASAMEMSIVSAKNIGNLIKSKVSNSRL